MAKVYADKIKYGKINSKTGEDWKLEDVPERYRDEVARILNPNDAANNTTSEEYGELTAISGGTT